MPTSRMALQSSTFQATRCHNSETIWIFIVVKPSSHVSLLESGMYHISPLMKKHGLENVLRQGPQVLGILEQDSTYLLLPFLWTVTIRLHKICRMKLLHIPAENTAWKYVRIRDNMQRRNLKDEECFDRELWRKKIMSLDWGKLCTHRKIPIYKACTQSALY
jgi:hypothetical protein